MITVFNRGEYTCINCGYTIRGQTYYETTEYITKEPIGSLIKTTKHSPYKKLALLQKRLLKDKTHTLKNEIEEYTEPFNLAYEIKEEILQLIKNTKLKGFNRKAYIAAAIFAISKIHNIPINKRELLEKTNIDEHTFARHLRKLYETNNIKFIKTNHEQLLNQLLQKIIPPTDPEYNEIRKEALQIINTYSQTKHTPTNIIIATIYLTLIKRRHIKQKDITNTYKISECTLRQTAQDIIKTLNIKKEKRKTIKTTLRNIQKPNQETVFVSTIISQTTLHPASHHTEKTQQPLQNFQGHS